jgi:transposase, IS5 family
VRGVEVTTANVYDAAELEAVLPSDPGDVYADSAFGGPCSADAIRAKGGQPAVVQTGTWGGPAALARLEARNRRIQDVRCRIEMVFGTRKRSYACGGCAGSAWPGRGCRSGSAVAYNLRRTVTLLHRAAA